MADASSSTPVVTDALANVTKDQQVDQATTPVAVVQQRFADLNLPDDINSPEFVTKIQALRPTFATREEFNAMVCDQLAARGVSPNTTQVRAIGCWGSLGHIQADVRAWHISLAKRLQSDQAHIPEPAKRQANALIEQLWTLLQGVATNPLIEMQDELNRANERIQQQQEQLAQVLQTHETAIQALMEQSAEQEAKKQELLESLAQANSTIAGLRQAVADRDNSIANEALKNKLERQTVDLELQRLNTEATRNRDRMDALFEQLNQSNNALVSKQALCTSLEDALKVERQRLDSAAREHALAIDKFRVDLRESEKRTTTALSQIEAAKNDSAALREKLAQANLDNARLQAAIGKLEEVAAAQAEQRQQSGA